MQHELTYGQRMKLKYPVGTTLYIAEATVGHGSITEALATVEFVSSTGEITCELDNGMFIAFMPYNAIFNKVSDRTLYTNDNFSMHGVRYDTFA